MTSRIISLAALTFGFTGTAFAGSDATLELEPTLEAAVALDSAEAKKGSSRGSSSTSKSRPSANSSRPSGQSARPAANGTPANAARPAAPSQARPSNMPAGPQGARAATPSARPAAPSAGSSETRTRSSSSSTARARPAVAGHARPEVGSHARPETADRHGSNARHNSHRPAGHHGSSHRPHPERHRHWYSGSSRGYHRHMRTHIYWYHGVFVYGPSPRYHSTVYVDSGRNTSNAPLPERKIDREDSFGIGVDLGSYAGGYSDGRGFSDFALGLSARYRPLDSMGFEFAYHYTDQTFDYTTTERSAHVLQPSIQVFAFSWSRVNPYASAGLTWAFRDYEDTYSPNGYDTATFVVNDRAFGPHLGLGIEFNVGDRASIDLEARGVGYLNTGESDASPGAFQANAGVNWYF